MAWRTAKSLEVLAAEVHAISPQTTIYFIGDAAHQAQKSDHNPNAAGVVCAEDIMQGHGLDLGALAEKIRTSGHPDLAYVIYDRRIATRKTGLKWTNYAGSDPHTDHIHVSVGVGVDGSRVPPYDDIRPWGIAPIREDNMDRVATIGGKWYIGDGKIRREITAKQAQNWIEVGVPVDKTTDLDTYGVDVATLGGTVDAAALAKALLADPAFASTLAQAAFEGAQRAERE